MAGSVETSADGTVSVVSVTGVAAGSVVSVAGAVAAGSSTVVVAAGVVSVESAAGLVSIGTIGGATGSVLSLAGMVSEELIVPPPAAVASVFALSSEAPLVAGTVLDASSGFVGVVTVPSAGLVVASVFGLLSEFPPSVFVLSVLVLSSPVADGTTTLVFESSAFFVLSLVASAAGLTAGFSVFVSLVSTGVLLASSFS